MASALIACPCKWARTIVRVPVTWRTIAYGGIGGRCALACRERARSLGGGGEDAGDALIGGNASPGTMVSFSKPLERTSAYPLLGVTVHTSEGVLRYERDSRAAPKPKQI